MGALWDGAGLGGRMLLDSGMEKAGELRRELLRQRPQNEVRGMKMSGVLQDSGLN